MTDLELYRPQELALTAQTAMERAADFTTWAPKLQGAAAIAREICQTDFVPAALRGKPAAVAAAIMAGAEMNLGPMASLMHIHIIEGRPSLSAEMQRALVLALGHHIRYREMTTTRCIVDGRRRGEDEWTTVEWSIDDAKRASLDGRQNWRRYPRRMLAARATGELCRMLFADALAGMPYSAEELEDDSDDTAAATSAAPDVEPKPRTAQRKQRTQTAPPAQPVTPPAPSAPAASAGGALPPLPGEEDSAPAVPDETAPSGPAAGADPTRAASSSAARDRSPQRTGPPSPSSPDGSGSTPDDAPGGERHRKLVGIVRAHFKRLGFHDGEDDAERFTATAVLAGVKFDLQSTNDLDEAELSAVADTLARCRNRDALTALIVAADKAVNDGVVPDGR